MNGHDRLAADRLKHERERALANCEAHLGQVVTHLRYVVYYNDLHGLKLDLPSEKQLLEAMSQCSRIHQLDKEKSA